MEPSTRAKLPGDSEVGCLSSLTSDFKEMGLRLLRKTFLDYRLARDLFSLKICTYISKGQKYSKILGFSRKCLKKSERG